MKRVWLFILTTILILQSGCDVDHGLAPLPGKLNARVAFRGTPPEDTQGVYLIVAPEFPPHAINELFQSPNSLPTGQDTVWTEIDLPYGHYEAFGLWWYSKDTRSNLADILSLPFDGVTQTPIGFDLTPDQPVVTKELNANWNNMNRDASLKGTVHFEGEFPLNTDIVAIAAFTNQPSTMLQYLVWMKSIDITIEPGEKNHQFTLPIKSGFIGYIAVFWLAENAALTDVQIVAEARDPDDETKLWKKTVAADETIENIEITVDWETVKPAVYEEAL